MNTLNEILWLQFGASIDMLREAIQLCPNDHWNTENRFWYISYHTLFFLDYYLSKNPDHFAPPSPFSLTELDPNAILPERVYTKEELLQYLDFCKQKCHKVIQDLTDETAAMRFINAYRNYSVLEILFYNMRHVQHHAAQLYLLLRQQINEAPIWISRTNDPL